MGLTPSHIQQQGLVISANNHGRIIIDKIQEHVLMPDYPATKDSQSLSDPGILHFIHCPKSPIPEGTEANKMSSIFTREMSRVSLL
jgi:hypothetical protein